MWSFGRSNEAMHPSGASRPRLIARPLCRRRRRMKEGGEVPASNDCTASASPRFLSERPPLLPELHPRCAGSAFDRLSGVLDGRGGPRHEHRHPAALATWVRCQGLKTFGVAPSSRGRAGRASTRPLRPRPLNRRHLARQLKTGFLSLGNAAELRNPRATTTGTSHATRSVPFPPLPSSSPFLFATVEAATLCRGIVVRLDKTMSAAPREPAQPAAHSQDRVSLSPVESWLRTSTTSRCSRRRSPLIQEDRGSRSCPARHLGYPRLPREARLLYSREAQWGGGAAERRAVVQTKA